MRFGSKQITILLATGAATLAIAAAPAAAAATGESQQSCVTLGTSTKCQSPGDVEINSSIPAPPAGPWAVYGPFWGGD
jgi:hypothetical protein